MSFTSPPPPSLSLRSTVRPTTPLASFSATSVITRKEEIKQTDKTLLVYGAPLDLLPQLISQFKSYGPSTTLLYPSCTYFLITYTSSASREKALCQNGKVIHSKTGFVLGVRSVRDGEGFGVEGEEEGGFDGVGNKSGGEVLKVEEKVESVWEWFWRVILE